MQIEVKITTWPLNAQRAWPAELDGVAGARAEFIGLVRREEDGHVITALEYEAYSPMAENVMRGILEELGRRHECLFVRVTHRVGVVPVGAAAIHVLALARHRGAALGLVTEFMDRLKQDVPIWKRRAIPSEEWAASNPT
ncbi:MAG: molybdenum cofactor biosynthesis protein MoaE [Verrucomicrobia bacterium]|nr:molybdenum cofactor biosynthesis protein MoaE [Verrucomicrobiota bacterium]